LIVLPAGIYHRCSNDETSCAKVMRLFVGEPVWPPFNRSATTDSFSQRITYLQTLEDSPNIAYGQTNIVVENPSDFDRVISCLEKNVKIILYFTAANDPQTLQLWCPDARKAQPLVDEILQGITEKFYFVEFPIIRAEYKENSDYFLRVHEKVKLTGIPTMGLWEDGKMEKRLAEGELHELENIRKFLVV